MNIYEISELAGVSIATVSRVLNNNPNVNASTKARIEKIISDNGYTPSKPGKKRRYSKKIGIICNSIRSPRSAAILEYIITALHNMNYDTFIACCEDNTAEKRITVQHFIELNVGAIIIEGTDFLSYTQSENSYLRSAADTTPIILLNSYLEHPNIYSIVCDEGGLIFSIAEEYIKQGKTNLTLLFASMSAYSTPLIDAFSHAFYVHNLETMPEQLRLCSGNYNEAYKFIDNLIKSGKQPDAVIATDDIMAAGSIRAMLDNGLNIPDDIEVIGLGNTYLAEISNLTSINCKAKEIAEAAIHTLNDIFNNHHAPTRLTFSAELINRATHK